MKKYPASPYPDEEIEWCADRIRQQFKTPPERSAELAIQAMSGMDGHGGDPCNRNDMQGVIDVVVKSWIDQK